MNSLPAVVRASKPATAPSQCAPPPDGPSQSAVRARRPQKPTPVIDRTPEESFPLAPGETRERQRRRFAAYDVLAGSRVNRLAHEIIGQAMTLQELLNEIEETDLHGLAVADLRAAGLRINADADGLLDTLGGAMENAKHFSWVLEVFTQLILCQVLHLPETRTEAAARRERRSR